MPRTLTAALCLLPLFVACAAPKGGAPAGDPLCGTIAGLPDPAREQVAAVAGLLALKPALAIDFTGASGETCLNTGGRVMAHFTTRPAETREDIVFFVDAGPLIEKGLRFEEFPALEPGLGAMEPDTWYRYEGRGREPHHGMEMRDRRWLMVASDVR